MRIPSPGAFQRGLVGVQAAVGFASAAVVVVYLMALLRLTPEQWRLFAWIIAGYAVAGTVFSELVSGRARRPIVDWLSAHSRGEPTAGLARDAFAALIDFPRRAFLLAFANYVAAGLIIGGGMKLGFSDLPAVSVMVIVAAATTAGLAMNALFFFVVKHRLGELQRALVAELPDPSDREVLVRGLPLSTKLLISLSGVAVSTVLFSVFLAEAHARQPLLRQSAELQQRYLARVAPRFSMPGGVEVDRLGSEAVELGIASRLLVVAPDAQEGPIAASAWAAVRESQAAYGDSSELGSRSAFAWRRLEDGRLLVAVLDEAKFQEHLGKLWTPFGLLLAVATGIAVLLARLIARDVRVGTQMLSDRAQQIASGDLREGEGFESEDELGSSVRADGGSASSDGGGCGGGSGSSGGYGA
jgi:hypothetical protein